MSISSQAPRVLNLHRVITKAVEIGVILSWPEIAEVINGLAAYLETDTTPYAKWTDSGRRDMYTAIANRLSDEAWAMLETLQKSRHATITGEKLRPKTTTIRTSLARYHANSVTKP